MKDGFRDLPVVDAHVHFGHPAYMPGLQAIMQAHRVGKFNLVCTPHRNRLSLVPDALYVKAHAPQSVYVFGGLDISALFMAPASCGESFAACVDNLLQMGCDGVKMIEGKPDMRKNLPIPPFDSTVYEPYWARLESSGVPLIFHVNDPQEFWDASLIPDWARQRGWFYGDGTFINNEVQYAEVLHVLERHPNLKVILAHFYFLSGQLPRLADLFERFPNLHVDLTPGIEMYYNLSQQPQASRDFFLRYHERIVFGTDIGAKALLSSPELGIEPDESALRIRLVRTFLEGEGEFRLDVGDGFLFGRFAGPFHGLGLTPQALTAIYAGNFERLAGSTPRPLDSPAIIAECARIQAVLPLMAATQPGVPMDASVAAQVAAYFSDQHREEQA